MSTERIDIVISDKVKAEVAVKINGIAKAARTAHTSVEKLNKVLASINASPLNRLLAVEAKLAGVTAKVISADTKIAISQQRLSTEIEKTNLARAKTLQATSASMAAELRLEAAMNRTIQTELRSAQALQRLSAETSKANTAKERLTQASNSTALSVNKLTIAEKNNARASEQLKQSATRTAIAKNQLEASATRASLATFRLSQAQERASQKASQYALSFSAIKGQILGITASLGALVVAFKLSDEYAGLENRLRSTGLEGEGLTEVMGRLTTAANDTRSSLAGTVELYSRLAISSKELGVSQNELIGFTTSLNQAILLSGANATEAQAGLIQLSQGMASGRLQGDELRSILEQLPVVADVIAKSMGVTRGELRKLGSEGKITAQAVLKAFKEAGPELGERFASQVTTGSQALQIMKNKMLDLAGNEGRGSLAQVTGAILDLIKALDNLKENGSLDAFAFTLESQLKSIRVAILGVSLVFTYVIPGLLSGFNKSLSQLLSGLIGMMETLANGFAYMLPDAAGKGLKGMVASVRSLNDAFAKGAYDLGESSSNAFNEGWESFQDIYAPEVAKASTVANLDSKSASGDIEETSKKVKDLNNELLKFTITYEKWYQDDIADPFTQINDELTRMENTLGKSDIDVKMMDFAEALKATKGVEADLVMLRKRLELYQEQADTLERQKEVLDSIKRTDFSAGINLLNNMQASGQLSTTGRQDYLVGQNTDLFAGTQEAMEANVRSYADMYERISTLRQNNDISEATASQMRTKVWVLENETRFQNTSTILGNLATLQQSTNRHLGRAGKAFAVSQATIDGILAVQKALASAPPPINYALAASTGVAAAVNVAKIQGLPGFRVGGYTGNVAENRVAGMVHGNEYVMDSPTVDRLGIRNLDALRSGAASVHQNYGNTGSAQSPSNGAQGSPYGSGNSGGVRIINVIDPSMIADFMQSSEGEAVFINSIRNNSDTIKSVVSM